MPPLKTHLPKLLILLLFSVSVKAQSVYKTPSGEKYHLATCRTVKNVSEEITISQAKELGLEPCKICKPQTVYASGSATHKAQGQGTTVQCSGITKSGTRCKHMTRIAMAIAFSTSLSRLFQQSNSPLPYTKTIFSPLLIVYRCVIPASIDAGMTHRTRRRGQAGNSCAGMITVRKNRQVNNQLNPIYYGLTNSRLPQRKDR